MEIFDYKNALRKNLRSAVRDTIYKRGLDYYSSGRVEGVEVSNIKYSPVVKIDGNVFGTEKYLAYVAFNTAKNEFVDMDCSCPYDFACKHSTAVALKFIDKYVSFLDAGGYYKKGIKPETINEMKDYVNGNTTKPENIKELLNSIGIDTDSVPKYVVDMLQKKMKTADKKEESLSLSSVKRTEKKEKSINKKYYIVLNFYGGYPYIRLRCTEDEYGYDYSYSDASSSAERILTKEKNILTKPQEELFKFIRDACFDEDNVNYGEFFAFLKTSGIKAYREDKKKNNEFFFLDIPDKINAELVLRENTSYYGTYSGTDFVFKLGDEYKNTRRYDLILSGKYVTVMEGNTIGLHKLPVSLVEMVTRAYGGEYRYGDHVLETILQEEEIIRLNDVIEDCRQYFNLKSEMKPNYNIVGHNNAEPVILADYDSQNASLEIIPAIDYGFRKLNVSDSVFYSNSKIYIGVKRRDYPEFGKKYLIEIKDKNIFYAKINKKMEEDLFLEFYNNAIAYGFSKTLKCKRGGEKNILHFFDNNWVFIKKLGYKIEFPRDEFNFLKKEFTADFKVDFSADNDWLAFDVACYCGGDKISIEDLKNYTKNGKSFIKTKEGKMFRITNREEFERFLLMLESFHENENGKFEGRIYRAPELDDIFTGSKYYSAKTASGFKKFMKEAKSGHPVKKTKLPAVFSGVLRDYQKDGVDWLHFLRKYRFAGILADDMGIGKTLQALALIEANKVKGRPSIVVAPKTLLHNWQDEVIKFTPKTKVVIVDGSRCERAEAIKKVKKCD
ncbi:MAG TPA: hypothetical protein ENI76_00160, partial [Ignavibacteria bacterium]|nr:hypothetical protein [Ignavibacteria bacterium]